MRALTVLLGSGGGAEQQQQERSPAERLHGWGGRRGAERPGEGPRGRGQRGSGACAAAAAERCEPPDRFRRWWWLRRALPAPVTPGTRGGSGGSGGSSPGPSGALLNHRRPLLPPHLDETGWGRAGSAPGPAPPRPNSASPAEWGGGAAVRGASRGAAVPAFYRGCETTPAVKPPRSGGGAAGWGRRGELGDSRPRRRGESVSHHRELPGVFAL